MRCAWKMLLVKLWGANRGNGFVTSQPSQESEIHVAFLLGWRLGWAEECWCPDWFPNLLDLGLAFISGFRSRAQGCAVNWAQHQARCGCYSSVWKGFGDASGISGNESVCNKQPPSMRVCASPGGAALLLPSTGISPIFQNMSRAIQAI